MSIKRMIIIVSLVLTISLLIASCGILNPSGEPSEEFINTSVAETVNAQNPATDQPIVVETPSPQVNLPTEAPTLTEEPATSTLAVAFVSPDHNAFFWSEAMAAPLQLTNTGDVREAIISSDGKRIAMLRSTDWVTYSIEIINSDGSDLRTLIAVSGFDALPRPADAIASAPAHVSWVPQTGQLAMSIRYEYEGPGSPIGDTLYLIDPNTAALSSLMTIDAGWSWDYTYSPDGSLIAISRPEGMDIYKADGSLVAADVITFPFVNTASEYAFLPMPTWSVDESALAVVVPPQDPWSLTPAESSVYYWELGQSTPNAQLKFTGPMTYWPMEIASIAPDLSQLVYLVRKGAPEDNVYALNLVNLDGSGTQQVADGELHNLPDWSTDSRLFYYHSDTADSFIVQPGSTPVVVPAFNQVRNVQWVDGEHFIGASGTESGWQLLLGSTNAPAQVIYSSASTEDQIRFTINR